MQVCYGTWVATGMPSRKQNGCSGRIVLLTTPTNQNMPQASLHGVDEGLTSKLNRGCLRAVILELMETPGKIKWSKAGVCRRIDRQVCAAITVLI